MFMKTFHSVLFPWVPWGRHSIIWLNGSDCQMHALKLKAIVKAKVEVWIHDQGWSRKKKIAGFEMSQVFQECVGLSREGRGKVGMEKAFPDIIISIN